MIDLLQALPKRHIDKRLTRLYRRFGLKTVFSVADAAGCLHTTTDVVFRIVFMNEGLQDSRFRASPNAGKIWLIPIDPFAGAAKSWADQYADVLRSLPSPFSAEQFSRVTGVPFQASNTLLSILVRYRHLTHTTGHVDEGESAVFRLPPRRIIRHAA